MSNGLGLPRKLKPSKLSGLGHKDSMGRRKKSQLEKEHDAAKRAFNKLLNLYRKAGHSVHLESEESEPGGRGSGTSHTIGEPHRRDLGTHQQYYGDPDHRNGPDTPLEYDVPVQGKLVDDSGRGAGAAAGASMDPQAMLAKKQCKQAVIQAAQKKAVTKAKDASRKKAKEAAAQRAKKKRKVAKARKVVAELNRRTTGGGKWVLLGADSDSCQGQSSEGESAEPEPARDESFESDLVGAVNNDAREEHDLSCPDGDGGEVEEDGADGHVRTGVGHRNRMLDLLRAAKATLR